MTIPTPVALDAMVARLRAYCEMNGDIYDIAADAISSLRAALTRAETLRDQARLQADRWMAERDEAQREVVRSDIVIDDLRRELHDAIDAAKESKP